MKEIKKYRFNSQKRSDTLRGLPQLKEQDILWDVKYLGVRVGRYV